MRICKNNAHYFDIFIYIMQFANNVRLLRKKAGMTQSELGEKIGVSYTAIVTYESGRGTPKFEGLLKMSELFNISLDDLVFKDLSQEPAQTDDGDRAKEELLKQAMQRLALMEELIKAKDPELAQKLGLMGK